MVPFVEPGKYGCHEHGYCLQALWSGQAAFGRRRGGWGRRSGEKQNTLLEVIGSWNICKSLLSYQYTHSHTIAIIPWVLMNAWWQAVRNVWLTKCLIMYVCMIKLVSQYLQWGSYAYNSVQDMKKTRCPLMMFCGISWYSSSAFASGSQSWNEIWL